MNNNSLKVVRELFDKNIKESNSEANQEKIIQLDRIMSSIGKLYQVIENEIEE